MNGTERAAERRRLPIGMATLREIRELDCYYVDKTGYARRLAGEMKYAFLSRPRRFGKSLFVDTLKELFEGNEPLFRGLEAHAGWDWSVRHPVLRLDFTGGIYTEPGALETELADLLAALEEDHDAGGRADAPPSIRFRRLIREAARRAGTRVVVLVDEYDKPILDALGSPEVARANRDLLRGLYSVVKQSDADIRFAFLTGVSRFSRVNLFSGLNNLQDCTLDPRWSAVCGYTERDLDEVFAPELRGLDRNRIREWYNGYNWRGPERLYNPWDLLLLFDEREFRGHWFETGTPRFLVDLLVERRTATPDLERVAASGDLLASFDVDDMNLPALLFQTGYLTITGEDDTLGTPRFRLGYPNREVREGLNRHLLGALLPRPLRQEPGGVRLPALLEQGDFEGIRTLFESFLASIPYEWHTRNDIARYEGYWASVFYSWFAALGLEVSVEESGSAGRLDLAVRTASRICLFEFKVTERAGPGAAMEQLKARGYADRYRGRGLPIHLVGVEFSAAARNLAGFAVEEVPGPPPARAPG